ncbi:MAG TPA: type II toxin-antitoxin system PemK/MazF family toxin [Candidatus Acidoferrales bacterium]|nr:type II toxin-antitoxin system PemK/MazF family toxin [Candidatus Acidoferrales bacterium]
MAPHPPAGWFPRRGEIYLVAMDKVRPVVVLSIDGLNRHARDVCLVALTTVNRPNLSLRVAIAAGAGGIRKDSWAKCDQVTTIPKKDLIYPPLGRVPSSLLQSIEEKVRITLGLVAL